MAYTPDKSTIDAFLAHFTAMNGFQQPNRFRIEIRPPIGLAEYSNIPIFATSIQTPTQGLIFFEDTVSPSGPAINVPVKRSYDERFLIEFIVDKDWKIRTLIDKWLNFAFLNTGNNNNNSTRVKYWEDIVGEIDIYALDANDKVNQTIILHDAWPRQIIPGQFATAATNTYSTLMVDFEYRYYTSK